MKHEAGKTVTCRNKVKMQADVLLHVCQAQFVC